MSTDSYELTAEVLYNQDWKCKLIIGYGAGIYVGSGVEAKYIAKASNKEIGDQQLLELYQVICDQHNRRLASYEHRRRPFFLVRWYRALKNKFTPEFKYPELPE